MIVRGIVVSLLVTFLGCAGSHVNSVTDSQTQHNDISLGKVQRELKIGMASAEVVEVLGPPNIVTTDDNRNEVWTYDKISNENVSVSESSGGSILIIAGGQSQTSNRSSQKTLTIIVKFDNRGKVVDYRYRSSTF